MAAKYTLEEKKVAKVSGQALATIEAGGFSFSGPVTADEHEEIVRFILSFKERRRAATTDKK